ncbi:hypothetical protein OHC33_009256 [Knufia fluminis]|uniref:Zn(2)-C6 fungal-type domain-containing protein n=1 Tax=Knufia fluminis TaxID=191047 RepID=A0AAN8E9G6_9EURO|nr:hypothetical protein OHC33_009256 [Knufia fluminis]
MASAPPVKKACDACHRRKVRCTGGQPCKNCGQASLQCTYLAIPQKKGPKGSRAKVITEIRDTQQQQSKSFPEPTSQVPLSPRDTHNGEHTPFDFNTPPMSPTAYVRNLDLLSAQTVDNCITFFLNHLYPTMPIFSRQHLNRLTLEYRHGPPEVYCLVLSLCSFIMVQPGMSFEGMPLPAVYDQDPTAARYRLANLLLKEIYRIRKNIDYVDNPTVHSVQISFFLFCSYFGFDKTNTCWYHLREASTLAHMLNMNEEATYKSGDFQENVYNRRFYWLLLITERANAIQRHKPLSMLATIELPKVDSSASEAPVLHGFVYLASLFRLIDDEFMALWNKAKSECSTSYISQLQSQLANTLPPVLECTENQAADVKITKHWLRNMVWQLSITNGYLSSHSPDLAMSFRYPFVIAGELIRDISDLSLQSMEVHGVGLIEKLFDISCTLSDVVTYVPYEGKEGDAQDPHEYLNKLLNLISRLRGGASRYVPMLMSKVQENLPNMSNPLTHMPHTLDAFMDSSASASSSPHGLPKQRPEVKQPPPQQVQIPSPAQSSPYPGLARQQSYNEHVHTPQVQHTPQRERLMFETYSPSVASHSHSERGMTPPIYGTTHQQYAHHATSQLPPPRSAPVSASDTKQEVWGSYHG